jgi:polar amino acid transport system substrate-binding protein
MHHTVALLLSVALAFCSFPVQGVTFLTEENPPFNYTEAGKPAGMSTEIVVEAARRAGVAADIRPMAWQAAYEQAQAAKDTCIYSISRLENRERLFAWVAEIGVNKWSVFGKDDFAKPVKALTDLRPFKIGGISADSKVEFLRANAVTNIKEVSDDAINPPRLFLDPSHPDHIDLWVTGEYSAKAIAAKAKAGPIKLVYAVRQEPLWLACSPRTDRETLKRLAAALDAMAKDGTQQRITARYEKGPER